VDGAGLPEQYYALYGENTPLTIEQEWNNQNKITGVISMNSFHFKITQIITYLVLHSFLAMFNSQ
jgi:hypothetical protein